jgi:hypothetical protein
MSSHSSPFRRGFEIFLGCSGALPYSDEQEVIPARVHSEWTVHVKPSGTSRSSFKRREEFSPVAVRPLPG